MKKFITALTATAAITTYGLADQAEASSTYKVQSGDTLWKIAGKNNVSVAQLKSWNNLSSDLILVNQNLKVEGGSSNASSSSSNSSSSSSASSSSNTSGSGSYTVKSGDTLSKIARAHGMNYRTLMSINNISSHIIHPGQKLSVSGSSSSSSSSSSNNASSNSSAGSSNNSSSSSSASSSSYTVKAGDTLSRIASAHGTTYSKIMSLNNLSSTIIYPGQKLSVSGSASSSSNSSSDNASASNNSGSNASSNSSVSAPSPAATNVSYGTNYYYWGDCTWYAFERRKQLGKPVGSNWGNASSWDDKARSQGYSVNSSPSVGAIMQANAWTNNAWGMGHVAVVERINSDGSILVSEMNFGTGQGNKGFRTISASQVSSHNFIH